MNLETLNYSVKVGSPVRLSLEFGFRTEDKDTLTANGTPTPLPTTGVRDVLK